ncbi:hypothetical protein F4824DRAFT_455886 [Ustulina deusta]|nr:hypothetical protein F4824DRAFT_455886 [Ustulina deusta]
MKVVETNDESASSSKSKTKAATEFHYYPQLPAEVKLRIWKYVFEFWSLGAHRFRLRVDPANPARLILQPTGDQKEDASAWRERHAFARVDEHSFDHFRKLRSHAATLYRDTKKRRRVKVEENGICALVDLETDLILFRFNYGTSQSSLSLLSVRETSGVFTGITRIAVETEFMFRGFKGTQKFLPFTCICLDLDTQPKSYCVVQMVRFLRFFKNLKEFYIVYPITKTSIHEPMLREAVPDKLPELTCTKPGVSQAALNVFRYLQEIAQSKELKEFHDRVGIYIEVLREDTIGLFKLPVWYSLTEIRTKWREIMGNQPGREDLQFKVLAWADLRGATVSGEEQPLRTSGRWY